MISSVLDDDLTLMQGTAAPLTVRSVCVRIVEASAERAHRRCIQVLSFLWIESRLSRHALTNAFDSVSP